MVVSTETALCTLQIYCLFLAARSENNAEQVCLVRRIGFHNKETPEAYRCGFLFSMGMFPTSPGVCCLPLEIEVQVVC